MPEFTSSYNNNNNQNTLCGRWELCAADDVRTTGNFYYSRTQSDSARIHTSTCARVSACRAHTPPGPGPSSHRHACSLHGARRPLAERDAVLTRQRGERPRVVRALALYVQRHCSVAHARDRSARLHRGDAPPRLRELRRERGEDVHAALRDVAAAALACRRGVELKGADGGVAEIEVPHRSLEDGIVAFAAAAAGFSFRFRFCSNI